MKKVNVKLDNACRKRTYSILCFTLFLYLSKLVEINKMKTKTCNKCGKEKPVDQFGNWKTSKDSLRHWCKICDNRATAESRARKNGVNIPYARTSHAVKNGCKICSKCKLILPVSNFSCVTDRPSGYKALCKACTNKAKTKKNKSRDTKETIQFRHYNRMASIRSRFKLTESQYQNMMNQQKGCCAICNKDFGTINLRARIDHDHKTGTVRGLLCHECNAGIGFLQDDTQLLLNAATYLDNHAYEEAI